MSRSNLLVFVVRVADAAPPLSPQLDFVRDKARCEFCDEPVYYNRTNYNNVVSSGKDPVLICSHCYRDGVHNRQGYTSK